MSQNPQSSDCRWCITQGLVNRYPEFSAGWGTQPLSEHAFFFLFGPFLPSSDPPRRALPLSDWCISCIKQRGRELASSRFLCPGPHTVRSSLLSLLESYQEKKAQISHYMYSPCGFQKESIENSKFPRLKEKQNLEFCSQARLLQHG